MRILLIAILATLVLSFQNCSQYKAADDASAATAASQDPVGSTTTSGPLNFVTDQIPDIPDGGSRVPIKMDAGDSSACVLMNDGTLSCWGANTSFQLASDPSKWPQVNVPIPLKALSEVQDFSMGSLAACAIIFGGSVKCWGTFGTVTYTTPTLISGVSNAVRVSVGNGTACALIKNGTVSCWGLQTDGVLGSAGTNFISTAVQISGISQVIQIADSGHHTCVLKNDGTVWCWGSNNSGEVAPGIKTTTIFTPTQIPDITANYIAAGDSHTCAILVDGSVKCWGDSTYSQTGTNLSSMSGVVGLGLGVSQSCAWTSDGDGYCWGDNDVGELGTSFTTVGAKSAVPVKIPGVSGIFSVASGRQFTCALTNQWKIYCFGIGTYGELGYGGTDYSMSPIEVSGF